MVVQSAAAWEKLMAERSVAQLVAWRVVEKAATRGAQTASNWAGNWVAKLDAQRAVH